MFGIDFCVQQDLAGGLLGPFSTTNCV